MTFKTSISLTDDQEAPEDEEGAFVRAEALIEQALAYMRSFANPYGRWLSHGSPQPR